MWQLKMSLLGTMIHVGQKVNSLGVKGIVKGIYLNGAPVSISSLLRKRYHDLTITEPV